MVVIVTISKQPYLLTANFSASASTNSGTTIVATIRFGTGEQKLPWGPLRFRINETYLSVQCKGCELSSENWLFQNLIERQLEVAFEYSSSEDVTDGTEFGQGAAATGPTLTGKQSRGKASRSALSKKFSTKFAAVSAEGSSTAPRWLIRSLAAYNFLEGTLCDGERFANCEIRPNETASLTFEFKIPRHGLSFAQSNNLSSMEPNKHGLIKHVIRYLYTEKSHIASKLDLIP